MKFHLGCGENKIVGWHNFDTEVDIRKRLPWADASAELIFAEHVIEHVTFAEGVRFLTECRRVLGKLGVLRLSFPDPLLVERLDEDKRAIYRALVSETATKCIEKTYLPLKTHDDSLRLLFCGWGHQSMWTEELARMALRVAGFVDVEHRQYGESTICELRGIDGHHRSSRAAVYETCVLEATTLVARFT